MKITILMIILLLYGVYEKNKKKRFLGQLFISIIYSWLLKQFDFFYKIDEELIAITDIFFYENLFPIGALIAVFTLIISYLKK